MSITVGDVLALPQIQRGEPEVLSRCRWSDPIRWVHIGDIPDLSDFLQGGELVLTTGAALANWPQRYLQSLSESGAVGVIVELGATLPKLPPAVAALAQQEDLALIALHRTVRFVEVTEAVHRRIVAEQYDTVAFDRQVHETFTELSMKRASVAGIVEAAAQMLNEPVVLEDLTHQVLAVTATADSGTEVILTDWERRSRRNSTGAPDAEPWTAVSVGPRAEIWGRLVVPREVADHRRTSTVLERAAAALAMHRMIERDLTGLHQQAQSGLLEDVLQRRLTNEAEVAARAHALGVARSSHYVPVAIRIIAAPGADDDPVAVARRQSRNLEAVAHAVRSGGLTGLFTTRGGGDIDALIALRPGRRPEREAQIEAMAQRVHAATDRLGDVTKCTIAVAASDAQFIHAIDNLDEAAHVAEVAEAIAGEPRAVYRAADVRLRGLVALLKDDPRVQAFAESELGPLLTAPPEQLDILRAYLQTNGNKAALAQRLHISRPALYKRLAAIADTLGYDIEDPESMLSLHVAILIHDAPRHTRSTAHAR